MSGRHAVRAAARRVLGAPDASDVGETLAQLRAAVQDLSATASNLGHERDAQAAQLVLLQEELARLGHVLREQATAIESLQSRLSADPGR